MNATYRHKVFNFEPGAGSTRNKNEGPGSFYSPRRNLRPLLASPHTPSQFYTKFLLPCNEMFAKMITK